MSSAKKGQNPPTDLPRPKVDKATEANVKGGAEPTGGKLKPVEPINGDRTK